ncbi:hypothetical protein [Heyndrickxia acidicola]|uniref:Uncharacterized protein n=1 Tax=Heyndrickxia acidicola TaxID=209389 RepID=A0ABU6MIK3_9BACI|nr:hypothetical protein [Heyndrickxia acidicola]MED1204503.1 hypothetical protein [Heyndrickxia acidicola]
MKGKSASRKDGSTSNVYLKAKCRIEHNVDWSGRHETPAGSAGLRETPQELATRLPATRGKRVPEAKINQQEGWKHI